ncbi:hypothetical protein QBC38DRAFT_397605 [Podospora fimiseda]|uniref:Zn(2)-C6 fungal-type domain-containing protein n=1 Tax=Podospora fimiseda TaxID=252190 RepID=A0AAN7BJN3_9PEZI|nr:hypothetical protein QBC38DRAFT_397605 [Podospora fimiseda]
MEQASNNNPTKAWPEHRPRRSHKKSRNGCSRCKARRIKCDEHLPKCSRCTKMSLSCQYPPRQGGQGDQDGLQPDHSEDTASLGTSSRHLTPSTGSPASYLKHYDSPLQSQVAQTLSPIEFELLRHYLDHTSKDLTQNENDQYTVQIGIPNLACQCKALMRSLLSLAAICQCADIIRQSFVSDQERTQVQDLLALSHQYHMEALRQVQLTLHETQAKYDHVLANAAIMGMYGSGSHGIRIWLTKTAPPGFPIELHLPKQPQWISFYRAVDLAYIGLLNNNSDSSPSTHTTLASSSDCPSPPNPVTPFSYKLSSRFDPSPGSMSQPSPITDHPLSPILSATVGTALSKLSTRIHTIAPSTSPTPELQACLAALERLNTVVSDIFPPPRPAIDGPRTPEIPVLEVDIDPVGQLKEVSPWMRRYIASITYIIPSRLPRRIIAAFIHKVHTAYLSLVEDVFAFISAEGDNPNIMIELSVVHQLALDIFAHWLVLFIMLDNVWWIGGIGAWELGRVIQFTRKRRQMGMGWGVMYQWGIGMEEEEDWWPESMWEVSRQFDKYRSD